MGTIDDYVHRIGRTARGKGGKGHALVFFEYYDKMPHLAGELVELLENSKQPVPEQLRVIVLKAASRPPPQPYAPRQWKNEWRSGWN